MKNTFLAIILALFTLVGCVDKIASEKEKGSVSDYYKYNPEDTVGNWWYYCSLSIDSARVDYHEQNPITDMDDYSHELAEFYKNEAESKGGEYQPYNEESYQQCCSAWFEFLDLCSKKQFEEAAHHYADNWVDLTIALRSLTGA